MRNIFVITVCIVTLLNFFTCFVTAFQPLSQLEYRLKSSTTRTSTASTNINLYGKKHQQRRVLLILNEKKEENPYADENYPDLEFVNYDDPNYVADRGMSDEFSNSSDDTEVEIEKMREERRIKNDEFQFQTYFKNILKNGEEYKGEWTIYKTSTFLDGCDDGGLVPELKKIKHPLKVISTAYKKIVDDYKESQLAIDKERICHEEKSVETEYSISTSYPDEMMPFDFRGQQGNMIVGNTFTTCTSTPLDDSKDNKNVILGPFSEYRVQLGLQSDQIQFRIKLDYSTKADEKTTIPALHLKSLAICREALNMWPPTTEEEQQKDGENVDGIVNSLYGSPGAKGGLYDPPLVGSDEQAESYMTLDLEGHATILFPYRIEQDPTAFNGNGWVTSLDWTAPNNQRYQVDRKVKGGFDIMQLRTLELSEVQGANADQYRPRDGGADMRQ
eukprot:CAMPEP_0194133434 /NCGR_PEP_ID=MMETSP0152-20130528/3612_1 /TAXON_ID=1049557 /ORGANISM="Thalassiothrix antarctica, Strain L6-D1" /LENGTH=444 /DNA_ID=CAMNT_0038828753 /DNA_START=1 /DNA_END=1335 /DNA_ORIENTATION=+